MFAKSPPVVVVVDGATGAGRLVSRGLAASGSAVAVVTHRDPACAAFLCGELDAGGHTALPYQADLDDPVDLSQLFDDLSRDLGRVDSLVDLLPSRSQDLRVVFHKVAQQRLLGSEPSSAPQVVLLHPLPGMTGPGTYGWPDVRAVLTSPTTTEVDEPADEWVAHRILALLDAVPEDQPCGDER